MSCESIKVQTDNKIDLKSLFFDKIKWLISEFHYICIKLELTLAKTDE